MWYLLICLDVFFLYVRHAHVSLLVCASSLLCDVCARVCMCICERNGECVRAFSIQTCMLTDITHMRRLKSRSDELERELQHEREARRGTYGERERERLTLIDLRHK